MIKFKVLDEENNHICFTVSSDTPAFVHRSMPFPDPDGQTVFATMADPPNRLLFQATAEALDEEGIEQDDINTCPHQPFDEFL